MNPIDIILIIVIAGALAGAVAKVIHDKKHGRGCCGSCSECHCADKKKRNCSK